MIIIMQFVNETMSYCTIRALRVTSKLLCQKCHIYSRVDLTTDSNSKHGDALLMSCGSLRLGFVFVLR